MRVLRQAQDERGVVTDSGSGAIANCTRARTALRMNGWTDVFSTMSLFPLTR